jgi:hypothetical protein
MKYARNWLRDAFTECYTREEWQERFKKLNPKEQADILTRLEPRKVEADGVSVILSLDGMVSKSIPIQAEVIEPEAFPAPTATPVPEPPREYQDDARFPSGPRKESSPDFAPVRRVETPPKPSAPRNRRTDTYEEYLEDEGGKTLKKGIGIDEGKR